MSEDDTSSRTDESIARRTDRGATRRSVLKTVGAGAVAAGLTGSFGSAAGRIPTPPLHTEGRFIKDPSGNTFKPRGFAVGALDFIGRSWFNYPVVPKRGSSSKSVLGWATDQTEGWHPNHVRLPITSDGINSDAWDLETLVEDVVRPAVDFLGERGVYALLDLHLIRPYNEEGLSNSSDSYDVTTDEIVREFWSTVAPEFAEDDHVIFELFNEPTTPYEGWQADQYWAPWKEAAQPWVDLVQEHAPARPLVIGSPGWTSVPDMAPEDPFEGDNLIYAGHIYPANGRPHSEWENAGPFDPTYGAPAEEVPIWITEFGWEPGSGDLDDGSTSEWGEYFREWVEGYENMGWSAWCFDDTWAPTFFESPTGDHSGGWELKDDPEEQGGFIKQWLADTKDRDVPPVTVEDSTAPPAPSPEVARTSEISLTVSWEPVTDEGEAGVSHYEIHLDGSLETEVESTWSQVTLDGFEPESTHEVGVRAVDQAFNKSAIATVDATTKARDEGNAAYAEHSIPGRLEAEDFDEGGNGVAYLDSDPGNAGGSGYRDTDVDLGATDANGPYVGFVESGEWLEYTVEVEEDGTYPVEISFAGTVSPAGTFRVEVDGEEVASGQGWQTGGWETFQSTRIGSADLSAGEHLVRVVAESGGSNFNWVQFGESTGNSDPDDTEAPTAPAGLSATDQTGSSVSLEWEAASDSGGSGLAQYAVYVDGSEDQRVDASTTGTTVFGLDPTTEYEFAVSAVDGAGNESDTVTVTASTGEDTGEGDEPAESLVVNDFESGAYPGSNALGNWASAGSFQNGSGEVTGGALRLEYDNSGWFGSQVQQNVSGYERLELVVRGDSGGEESDFALNVGSTSAPLGDLTSDAVGTSFSTVAVPLDALEADFASLGEVRLDFWQGASGAVEIDEIRFASGSDDGGETEVPSPSNLTVAESTSTSVTVSWDPVTVAGDAELEAYNVVVGDSTWSETLDPGTTEYTLDDLTPGGEYTVTVSAVATDGTGSDRATITATTDGGEDQTLAVDLSVEQVSSDGTAEATITLSEAPDGVSGYDLTVGVADTSVAQITDASYPEGWFNQGTEIAADGSSAALQAIDGSESVQSGASDVDLATVTLGAQAAGETDVGVTVEALESDADGAPIPVSTDAGTLTVGGSDLTPIDGVVPQDLDGDGKHMDMNGNEEIDADDVVIYFNNYDQSAITNHVDAYDFNDSGEIDFDDIVTLFQEY